MKNIRRLIALLLAVLLAVSSLTACGGKDKGNAGENAGGEVKPDSADKPKAVADEPVKGNAELKLGDMSSDGYALFVPADTFAEGSKIEVTEVSGSDIAKYKDDDRYEIIGTPVHVTADTYEGAPFGTDVRLTLPMPEDLDGLEGGLGQLVILYFDEKGNVTYMLPDSYDSAAGTMSVDLPHLSPFSAGKLTEKEQVEMFLDRYSTSAAVAASNSKQAAADLEPYIKAKIAALGLTEEAGQELTLSVINYIGSGFGEDAEMYTGIATSAYKSIDSGDAGAFEGKMEEIISGQLYDMINYNVFTGKADSKFKDAGKVGTILGAVAGGDTKEALKEIGGVIGDVVPEIGLVTKAVGYVGAKVNEEFTNWKSNQIEELYQKYKNGYEDMWGNEVIAGDEESLKTYIHTGSGLSRAKGVYRFYNMDKAAETCERYGWGRKDYDELDEHYREIFDQRAEEGLLNYFRTRKAQEEEAARIKETERECIEEMMKSYGCLSSGNYRKFFGEQSDDDFNLTERLDRIVRVRGMLTKYVDTDALAQSQKDGIYNWGVLMNDWVSLVTEKGHDEAEKLFISNLKSYGVLNKAYDLGVTVEDLVGEYEGEIRLNAVRVTEELYQLYMASDGGDLGAYGDLDINSKADCDAALAEYIDDGMLTPGQGLTVTKTGDGTCLLTGSITNEEGTTVPITAQGKVENGKLMLSSEEGTTEAEIIDDGVYIRIRSGKAVFLLVEEEDGEKMSLLLELSLDIKK